MRERGPESSTFSTGSLGGSDEEREDTADQKDRTHRIQLGRPGRVADSKQRAARK